MAQPLAPQIKALAEKFETEKIEKPWAPRISITLKPGLLVSPRLRGPVCGLRGGT
jgi:hypothetical protein